ncbi:MAG: helix-turn-helix transcriptional regulator, partial [Myxococcota bacterium]
MGRGEDDGLRSQLRRRREAAGLSQQALGDRVGVTRQAVLAIEAGRRAPSTPLALRLARALSCRVEDLFTLAESEGLDAELSESLPIGARVLVGRVDERWVAHPVAGAATPADALVERSGVRPLVDAGELE